MLTITSGGNDESTTKLVDTGAVSEDLHLCRLGAAMHGTGEDGSCAYRRVIFRVGRRASGWNGPDHRRQRNVLLSERLRCGPRLSGQGCRDSADEQR